ncbi:MAG: DUF6152 family protein [Bryobacteraceae bacterium]
MNHKKIAMFVLVAAMTALFVVTAPVFAHHGTAAFNTDKEVVVKGEITDFVFSNPHVQVFFKAKNEKGEWEQWQGELTAPNKLIRAGWNKRSLKPGDQVTITGLQVKSGEKTLWIGKIIGPDGQPMNLRED